MSPDELAQTHSRIIDAKLNDLRELFKNVNVESAQELNSIFSAVEFDNNSNVINNTQNRVLINRAIGIIKRKTRSLRPIVFAQYLEASTQINALSEAYIKWLREQR